MAKSDGGTLEREDQQEQPTFGLHFVLVLRASLTRYHTLVASTQQNFISHSSGGWKSKIKVLIVSVSSEDPLWFIDAFSLHPHMAEGVRQLLGLLLLGC
jgi:hypothetical protein